MSKSLHHHRKHHPHPLFTLDGNTRTFHPPQYQPLLDYHLKPFFYAHNRLKILKKNKLINGKNKVVDKTITKKFLKEELMTRPSMFQTISPKKGGYGKTAAKSVILTSIDVSGEREGKSLYQSEGRFRGIALGGIERVERYQKRQGKWRATQGDGKEKANKTVSKELFQVFLDRQKDRIKERIQRFE